MALIKTQKEVSGYLKTRFGKTYFRRLLSGKNKTPIICLHGGPGGSHFLMRGLDSLAKKRDIIFYDQIGCGLSDRLRSKNHLRTSTFIHELEALRKALKINKFILLGHSWGTMLGMEYYLKNPQNIEKIIFSSPCLSASLWHEDAKKLIAKLPKKFGHAIQFYGRKNKFRHPKYARAVGEYYKRHVFGQIDLQSPEILMNRGAIGMDVYQSMWGPHEFKATGVLKSYERIADLKKISVPTLFIVGDSDEATPEAARIYAGQVEGSRVHILKNAAHLTFLSNPKEYNHAISSFIEN